LLSFNSFSVFHHSFSFLFWVFVLIYHALVLGSLSRAFASRRDTKSLEKKGLRNRHRARSSSIHLLAFRCPSTPILKRTLFSTRLSSWSHTLKEVSKGRKRSSPFERIELNSSLPSSFADSSFLWLPAGYFVQTEILSDEVPSPYAGKHIPRPSPWQRELLLTRA